MSSLKNFVKNNDYIKLFTAFFKLGLFTFGGGMAMVPILQETVCQKYGWMTEDEVIDCLAVSQGLPGVIAINMATYTGYFKKGLLGAIVASLGMILPSFIIIIMVVSLLESFGENPYLEGALTGIRAAATGLVAFAAIKLGKQILTGLFQWMVAAGAFIAIALLGIDAVWVILVSMLIGILYSTFIVKDKMKEGK